MPPLLQYALSILLPLATSWACYILADRQTLEIPLKLTMATAGGLFGIAVVVLYWTISYILKLRGEVNHMSKIEHAKKTGRIICQCSEQGEIMVNKGHPYKSWVTCKKCGSDFQKGHVA